jgi:hypothetical protein
MTVVEEEVSWLRSQFAPRSPAENALFGSIFDFLKNAPAAP